MAPFVLIVDDSPLVRARLSRSVAGLLGVQILEASDGLEALSVLRQHAASLMILDLDMPRMTGCELLEQLRRDEVSLPVIVVSANASSQRKRLLELGAAAILDKPWTDAQLRDAVARSGAMLSGA